ncbi:hypothetical protein H8356DRAFT_1407520 [Neocallimastix lanati (nom. inval.)]|uniref:Uncharacterized protein n=1 Tax=Neocallimastix californiae TaxID=1754190 RepID=A0A1Y2AYN3_9FUNG|nr:hypothetical protein H8356DRAFT_1407520 [Neocallimastix sp. JGI-2020a]ORY27693.1 hypothetical protein LY90DRAFT_513339 [Neocallimastix californiae]|eukprot:ORY27693.1 hypothetical protein LY90DRAFT_513339 [Neocallimastix californiae]
MDPVNQIFTTSFDPDNDNTLHSFSNYFINSYFPGSHPIYKTVPEEQMNDFVNSNDTYYITDNENLSLSEGSDDDGNENTLNNYNNNFNHIYNFVNIFESFLASSHEVYPYLFDEYLTHEYPTYEYPAYENPNHECSTNESLDNKCPTGSDNNEDSMDIEDYADDTTSDYSGYKIKVIFDLFIFSKILFNFTNFLEYPLCFWPSVQSIFLAQ